MTARDLIPFGEAIGRVLRGSTNTLRDSVDRIQFGAQNLALASGTDKIDVSGYLTACGASEVQVEEIMRSWPSGTENPEP